MTVPKWQPGTTYSPGALVVPRSSAPPAFTGLDNPKLTDTTGWDLDSPLAILADGQGYAGEGRIACQGTTNQATGKNQAHIPVNPGQKVGVSAMCAHGTSDKQSSDGLLYLHWYKSDDTEIGTPANGSGLPSLSNAGWQQLSVSGTAPAGVAYCRIGFGLYRHGSDTIQISHFTLNYTPQAPARAAMYEATQPKPGKSGSTEPVWPGVGESVQDNEVTWNGVNIDRLVWQASPLLESGDTEPDWPTAPGGTVHDGTIDWIANSPQVTDPNCPNSKIVTMGANKIFAGDRDITRYCATNNALDWSTEQDAGYLPTGLYAIGETDVTALNIYRANLASWTASSIQVWQIDPDPANMAFIDAVIGGTSYYRSAQPISNDLQFLSNLGIRSVGITATTGTMGGTDVGSPVDTLIRALLKTYNDAIAAGEDPGWEPVAIAYPNLSQNWVFFGNEAYVYSLSALSKVSAWSHYTLPFYVTDPAILDGALYVRTTDNDLYVLDESQFSDDNHAQTQQVFDVQAQTPWLQLDQPGVTQMLVGVDAVISQGAAGNNTFVSVGWDENTPDAMTPEVAFGDDTLPGAILPVPTAGPALSFKLRNASPDSWEYSALTVYFNPMRTTA